MRIERIERVGVLAGTIRLATIRLATASQPPARARYSHEVVDLIDQHIDSLAGRGHRAQYRHFPTLSAAKTRGESQIAHRLRAVEAVRLVHDQYVGNLDDTRLDRLDLVSQSGRQNDDARICQRADRDFRLSGAHGLHDHRVKARGVHCIDDPPRGARKPAKVPARRCGADEHLVGPCMRPHADPVAEHRSSGDRARRIDGQHCDSTSSLDQSADQGADQRRLPGPERAGDPHDAGPSTIGRDRRAKGGCARAVVLEEGDAARQLGTRPPEKRVQIELCRHRPVFPGRT